MTDVGPALDTARRLVVERNLVRRAFEHLTVDAFMTLPFEALAPAKALLKRFFSPEPWGRDEDDALAAAAGPGTGTWQRQLDEVLTLEYGWPDGRFRLRVTARPQAGEATPPATASSADDPLAASFDGPVVPEATPNPRTIRFHVGPLHAGPSRWYESAPGAEQDPQAAALFDRFSEIANVLVGPDFVAISLRRPGDWERLLSPVLAAVAEGFAPADDEADDADGEPAAPRVMGGPAAVADGARHTSPAGRRLTRLEQAWRELGSLRAGDPGDLARVRTAAAGDDPSHRQVAASLLREAPAEDAASDWGRLVVDPARSVRRAAVDAMVDASRQTLRPLLEQALADPDPWVRWKALRGLAELGAAPSRNAIAACAGDPDFRVRLEAAAALRPRD